jgi:hypothetical protein
LSDIQSVRTYHLGGGNSFLFYFYRKGAINISMSLDPPEIEVNQESGPVLGSKWDYSTFKEYLFSQTRGKEFILPLAEFPDEIEISQDWHNTLNTMRDGSNQDKVERVAIPGYNTQKRALYLPNEHVTVKSFGEFERGGVQSVHPKLIEMQLIFAKANHIEGSVGILHSHPPHASILGKPISLGPRLSAGDLYIVLGGHYGSLMGVAAGSINSFAFRTRESILPRDTQDTFYDLWEREPQIPNLDQVLAEKLKIALYKGDKDGSLKRVYPKREQPKGNLLNRIFKGS